MQQPHVDQNDVTGPTPHLDACHAERLKARVQIGGCVQGVAEHAGWQGGQVGCDGARANVAPPRGATSSISTEARIPGSCSTVPISLGDVKA